MKKAVITFTRSVHNGTDVIRVQFEHRQDITDAVRNMGYARYEPVTGMWYIPAPQFRLGEVFQALSPIAYLDYSALQQRRRKTDSENSSGVVRARKKVQPENDAISAAVERFRDYLRGVRYSDNTIKTYCGSLQSFLRWTHPKPIEDLCNADVNAYVIDHLLPGSYSFSFQNQLINAVKLFFREVLQCSIVPERLQRPRREYKLPNVLSKEEVAALLSAHGNLKHRAMLSLIYACGLRRSELLSLKPADVDSKRHLLKVMCGKGRKDRVVPISDNVITMLREYYKAYRPETWLFEGRQPGSRYSEQSLQSVLKQAVAKAGIKKPVTLHWLRHSYATHLLEKGVDLRYIQALLGHSSSRTTEIYTHVTETSIQSIQSPFDDL